MEETDLRGLSPEDARAYVLEYITAMKTAEREAGILDADMALWEKRVKLAAEKGEAALESGARAKLEELAARRAALISERDVLAAKIQRMREQLPMLKALERTVDTDLLLAQLQMATGEALGGPSPALEAGLAAMNADDALAALKRKLSGQPESGPTAQDPASPEATGGAPDAKPEQGGL